MPTNFLRKNVSVQEIFDQMNPKTKDKVIYTEKHRLALMHILNALIPANSDDKVIIGKESFTYHELNDILKNRLIIHDVDKLALLFCGYHPKSASTIHRMGMRHHMENNLKHTEIDMLEAVLDYESAGLTKPDKPRNAYLTIKDDIADNTIKQTMLNICTELGIDNPDTATIRYPDFKATMSDYELFEKAIGDINWLMHGTRR